MQETVRRQFLLIIDLALIAAATVSALVLRDNFEVSASRLQDLLPYLGLTLVSATVVLLASRAGRAIWRFSGMSDYLRVVAAVILIVLGALTIGFHLNRLDGIARALPVIQGLLMMFALVGVRVAMRLRHARRHQVSKPAAPVMGQETVLVVGLNTITELFLRSVDEFAPQRVKIAGIVGRSPRHSGRLFQQHQILGMAEEIESILKTLDVHGVVVDRIVVTAPFAELSPTARQSLIQIENTSDIRLDLFAERIGLDDGAERGSTTATSPPDEREQNLTFSVAELEALTGRPCWYGKRAMELAAALALCVVLAPVMVLVAFVVLLDLGLPAVFWQQRPGFRGRTLKLYKFRTMGDAHDDLGRRIPDEQRVSAIGHFLRRTRLDELPQIYNILVGEMSFVGPRPLLPVDQPSASAARLLVRPGLTGWAQVSGGREISTADKSALDLWYVRNASLWLDLKILARTVPMLVFGEQTNSARVRQAWDALSGSSLGMHRPNMQSPAAHVGGPATGRLKAPQFDLTCGAV